MSRVTGERRGDKYISIHGREVLRTSASKVYIGDSRKPSNAHPVNIEELPSGEYRMTIFEELPDRNLRRRDGPRDASYEGLCVEVERLESGERIVVSEGNTHKKAGERR